MNKQQIQNSVNAISQFLALRDIDNLDSIELEKSAGINRADILVLLGNSIPYTIKCVSEAFDNNLCKKILINGGIGHSTEMLRNEIRKDNSFDSIKVGNRAEADIFFDIMTKVYNIPSHKIIVENKSTNCGDNALKAVELLDRLNIEYRSMILIQDPTMQHRTYASFLKYVNKKVKLINYSPFIPVLDEELRLTNTAVDGIWEEQRYLELIMGEIPRLRDDTNGYGPCGKNFIAHVDIPREIEEHYNILKKLVIDKNSYGRC